MRREDRREFPSDSRFERGRGSDERELPSDSSFERGRGSDVAGGNTLRLAFRAREGVVVLWSDEVVANKEISRPMSS